MKSSPHNWVQSPVYPKQPRFFCSLLNCQTKHLQDCWSHPFREIIPYLVTVLTHAKGMIIQVDTAVSLQQNHRGSMCIWMRKRHIHMFWASANQESGYIFSSNSTKKNRAPHVFCHKTRLVVLSTVLSERPSHIEPVVGFNTGSDQIPRSCNEVIHQKQKELSDTGGSTCASMDALFYCIPKKVGFVSIKVGFVYPKPDSPAI